MIYLFFFLSIINTIFVTTKIWQDNDVEVIPVDKIKWLNEKKHRKKVRSFSLAEYL